LTDAFGVCVVGYGMGRWHCQAIRQVDGLRLVAVCDLDETRRQRAIAEQGVKGYATLDDALNDDAVQVIVLATPHDTHAPLAVQAMEAGKHVVVEKVMSPTVEDADEMIAARDKNAVLLTVFHNRRFDSDFLTVKAVIEAGWLGDIVEVQSSVGHYGKPRGWRAWRRHGGGMIYDWGAHLFDQLLQLFGTPSWVFCRMAYGGFDGDDYDVETHSHTLLGFPSGVAGVVELSHFWRLPRPRWRVIGKKGTLVKQTFDPNERAKIATNFGRLAAEMEVATVQGDWLDFYRRLVTALRGEGEPPVKPEEARQVVRVICAALQSAERGSAVSF
jgi:scyllo-inositol 2-dehydrogenase (NADP+)